MGVQTTDLYRAKKGVSVLFACVVQTIGESDPTFQIRFLKRLEAAYRALEDVTEGDVTQELELLSWTNELLSGFDFVSGQRKPFLDDYRP